MRGPRPFEAIVTVALVLIFVGGALLFARINSTATANSHFICAFGSAVSERPLKPRNAETAREFRQRVHATRMFVRSLEEELDDCEQPTLIVIDPKGRDELRDTRPDRPNGDGDREGGDADPSPNQGSGQPGGQGAPDLPDLPNPPPPPVEAITDEVTQTVCESWDELMPPQLPDPLAPLVCP